MLPFFFIFSMVLVWISGAIQISINNQQYARMHTLFLTFNSPYYPQNTADENLRDQLNKNKKNVMILGVGNLAAAPDVQPVAPTQDVLPAQYAGRGQNDSQSEPNLRVRVRVRNTVSLCTGTHLIDTNSARVSFDMNDSDNLSKVCLGVD